MCLRCNCRTISIVHVVPLRGNVATNTSSGRKSISILPVSKLKFLEADWSGNIEALRKKIYLIWFFILPIFCFTVLLNHYPWIYKQTFWRHNRYNSTQLISFAVIAKRNWLSLTLTGALKYSICCNKSGVFRIIADRLSS